MKDIVRVICDALFHADFGNEVESVTHYANDSYVIHFTDGDEIELQEVKHDIL